ncbi:MAG: hypothetical protein F9K16_02455 [Thermoanaerobaculia bacterium]|nr:MAG: hypothetical protein F9K16_02455 [Thermoanaerobaculia bacterium]MBZ0103811.1 hypothetical protein [Thermoanaerobaculia bacterium]
MLTRNIHVALALALTSVLLACGGTQDSTGAGESTGSVSWEPGEWAFDAELDPWPAAAGTPVTLRAVASVDDNDEPFSGTVSYRLATSDQTDSWTPMRHVGDDEGDRIYESTVTLPSQRVGIHFLVARSNDGTIHELTDWAVVPQ